MLTIPVHDFQANLLSYLSLIKTGEQITVTENGQSLATIASPISQPTPKISIENLDAPFTKSIMGVFKEVDDGEDYKVTLNRIRMEKYT